MRSAMVGTGERAVIVEQQQHKRRLMHASVFNSHADLIRLDYRGRISQRTDPACMKWRRARLPSLLLIG